MCLGMEERSLWELGCLFLDKGPCCKYYADYADDSCQTVEVPLVACVTVEVVEAEMLHYEEDYCDDH